METILSWDQGLDLLIGPSSMRHSLKHNVQPVWNEEPVIQQSEIYWIWNYNLTAGFSDPSITLPQWLNNSWSQCEMSEKATGHPLAHNFFICFRKCQESLSSLFGQWIIYYLFSLRNLPRLGGLHWGSDTCPGRGERVQMKDEMCFCCVSLCGTLVLSLFKL